ncbi:NUDIX hydrolase [Candidatus Woesebacteria bacterium]|nr:NUDIX hydrolase [Candidatus Woesebacteria bacterium]
MDSTPPRILQFSFSHVPPVMKRGRHALIMVRDQDGKYILGAKDIYPAGIVRFVGGGLEEKEDPRAGAARELQEELGLSVHPSAFKLIATIVADISEESTNKIYQFTTYLFGISCDSYDIRANDDLDGFKSLTAQGMKELIDRYSALSSDLIIMRSKNPLSSEEEQFRWSDYGKLYGEIHKIGLEASQIGL